MQKVARRAVLARNQAKRKARINAEKDRHQEWKLTFQEKTRYNRSLINQAKDERLARREDWMLGPLAPKRDIGERASLYGTVSSQRLQPPKLPKENRRKYLNIVAGDRVCMMKGKDKGKIGAVLNVHEESEHVAVEGVNVYDIEYPEFAIKQDTDKRPYRSMSIPVPIDDVRLVVPLDDPKTGAVKDVIVKHVYAGGPFLEQEYGSPVPRHTRYISGLDIEIPWPQMPTEEERDEDVDTLRIDVESKTYFPSLIDAPFPLSVIDELRNKFSKYRQRHDPDWAAEKEREDLYEEWKASQKLLTPKAEFLEHKLAEKQEAMGSKKDENGNLKVSPETASFIHQFMARQGQKKNANA